MKKISLTVITTLLCFVGSISAQQPVEKTKKAAQKLNEKTAKVAVDVQEAANNVNGTANNIKAILKVFDPFLVQIKGGVVETGHTNNAQNTPNTEGASQPTTETTAPTPNVQPMDNSSNNTPENISNSTSYNSDGTANWGCQDHQQYGCYLDAQKGVILDDVDVATQTGSIDVIFTACNYSTGYLYTLMSPRYAKVNTHARVFFTGEKYRKGDYPTKQWQEANASTIAEIRITGQQFEKIKNNDQLVAVVNQTAGFKDVLETNKPLKDRVFAVKTQLENRTTYALIYVVEQLGTAGSSSSLKVKLKVNGVDTNGDGLPDTN